MWSIVGHPYTLFHSRDSSITYLSLNVQIEGEMAKLYHAVFLALVFVAPALAYPQFWAEEFAADNCNAVPAKGYDCHKTPVADR